MIKGMRHVGMSVSSLDRSLAFYRDLLGMEIVGQGPFGGEQYETILGLSGARGRVALLRSGDLQIELFEFAHPAPASQNRQRPVCDHGISHFCVEVTDIDRLYESWLSAGVYFHCPPLTFFGTVKATYGRDPDGNVFELIEHLQHK
jgi:catechol 2,3-dioxygenase-like lactoylglutathione lyase family enzyme